MKITSFIIGIVCIVSIALLLSGCCGSMNVQNSNKAIDSWNNLVVIQRGLDSKASNTVSIIGDHITTYNNDINQNSPNYDMLISNYQTDKTNLQGWNTDLSNLDNAITDFSSNSASLSGNSKQDAITAVTNARTYHSDMQDAQNEYIGYCDDMITYIKSCQSGNPDSSLNDAANSKKNQANTDIQNAVAAISQASDSMARVGK